MHLQIEKLIMTVPFHMYSLHGLFWPSINMFLLLVALNVLPNSDDATIYNNDENLSYSVFDDLHYFKKP